MMAAYKKLTALEFQY